MSLNSDRKTVKILKESKPDKNGTVTITKQVPCSRCGGTGTYSFYAMGQRQGGVCFGCNGKGFNVINEKIFTPEYRKKLDQQNEKRRLKKRNEDNKKEVERYGLNNEYIYVVTEPDTYLIKTELYYAGATYDSNLGWFFKRDEKAYKTKRVKVADFTNLQDGLKWVDFEKYNEKVREQQLEKTDYVSEVGQRIELELKLIQKFPFETQWGLNFVYLFQDTKGNRLAWKTSKSLLDVWPVEEARHVKATIKSHEIYNNHRQTAIKNVKIINE